MKQLLHDSFLRQRSWLGGIVRFVRPFMAYKVLGRVSPVLASYKITHKCNLKCLHCPYWKRPSEDQSFEGVIKTLQMLRRAGVLILILEGGEPLLWKDGGRDIRDVVATARRLFPSVCMTTNGTLPWGDLPLNRVWVSLDGPEEMNDSLRGKGVFEAVFRNIERGSQAQRVFASITISALNIHSIPELISFLKGRVAGATIQFYYPYQGLPDPLYVELNERRRVLNHLIEMKRQGYPIVNTEMSLRELQRSRWLCEDRLLANADPDGTISHGCYLKNRGPSVCELCGFTAHNEMTLAFHGDIASIRTGLATFFQ
uniref:Radical SAM protein n=1 Tax=Desulfomonile tiedjei TaxID=2358 RepID=A0A7C4EY12_9BACT